MILDRTMKASGPAASGRQLPSFNSCTLCTFDFWEKAMSGSSFRSKYSFAPASHSIEPGPLSLFHSILSHAILIPFYMYNRNISNLSPLHSSQSVIQYDVAILTLYFRRMVHQSAITQSSQARHIGLKP